MIKNKIKKLLRSPGELKLLKECHSGELQTEEGNIYPIIDGILCLLKEEERKIAVCDDNFYDSHPFGERNWSNTFDIIDGVEKDFKLLLKKYPKSALIIDVGSGTGRISNYLSLSGYENTVSLDYSFYSLKQIKRNSENVCIWGNNLHLPIESKSFDLAVSTGVIHHIPNPYKALKECIRILKYNGILYLRTYNKFSLYCLLYYTYGSFLRLCKIRNVTKAIINIFGFKIYRFVRSFFFSLPKRNDNILRAKFENLFMKKIVYFFSKSEIEKFLIKNGMVIEEYKKSGLIHRMLCYVARKKT